MLSLNHTSLSLYVSLVPPLSIQMIITFMPMHVPRTLGHVLSICMDARLWNYIHIHAHIATLGNRVYTTVSPSLSTSFSSKMALRPLCGVTVWPELSTPPLNIAPCSYSKMINSQYCTPQIAARSAWRSWAILHRYIYIQPSLQCCRSIRFFFFAQVILGSKQTYEIYTNP